MTFSIHTKVWYNVSNLDWDFWILGFIEYLCTYYHTFIFLDKSRSSQIGRPICTVILTYLVPFCPILLEIPTYLNIGRPLWMFPIIFRQKLTIGKCFFRACLKWLLILKNEASGSRFWFLSYLPFAALSTLSTTTSWSSLSKNCSSRIWLSRRDLK